MQDSPNKLDGIRSGLAPQHRRLLLAALALLIAAGAGSVMLLFQEQSRTKMAVAAEPSAGARQDSVIDDLTFDFGMVPPGEEITHEFVIRNPGAEALKLLRAESSCSCLTVVELSSEIQPGQEGRVKLVYRAPAPGVTRAEVLVETNRSAGRLIQLQWSGLVSNPRPKREVPAELYVSMVELDELQRGTTQPALIDVRSRAKFEHISIPNAMHYPLHMLKTLGFLRGKHIVLITEGHQDETLFKDIEGLRQRGALSVRILAGGLRAWRGAGKVLTGSVSEMAEVMTIPPGQFEAWTGSTDWTIIRATASTGNKGTGAVGIAGAKLLRYEAGWTKEQWRAAIAPFLSGPTKAGQLLFVSDKGEHYRAIEEAAGSAKSKNIFYLEGGVAGFNRWAQSQTTQRDSKTVTMTARDYGATSSAVDTMGNQGCGTCPEKKR